MYDLTNFTLGDMTACGAALRQLSAGAGSMEEVAGRVVRHLHDGLRDGPGGPRACALVRFFKTHPYGGLDPGLQAFARRILEGQPDAPPPTERMKCLTLLATAGDQPRWNSRHTSAGHQAIPLASAEMLVRFPMTSQLVRQFGLEVPALLRPEPTVLVDPGQKGYNVFHVEDARGSPLVPDQEEFVRPHRVRSVLGFGGVLPGGDLFVVILFSRVAIAREATDLFRPPALSVKLAVLPFAAAVFAPAGEPAGAG
jgi:hypothetical protein